MGYDSQSANCFGIAISPKKKIHEIRFSHRQILYTIYTIVV